MSKTADHDAPDGQPVEVVADKALCEALADDLGIKASTAKTAFINEPTRQVLGVAAWALDKSDVPEERARMLVAWAKKRRAGAFRPLPEEYVSLAGDHIKHSEADGSYRENLKLAELMLKYWNSNPKRLAALLTEIEIWMNVREDELSGDGRS